MKMMSVGIHTGGQEAKYLSQYNNYNIFASDVWMKIPVNLSGAFVIFAEDTCLEMLLY